MDDVYAALGIPTYDAAPVGLLQPAISGDIVTKADRLLERCIKPVVLTTRSRTFLAAIDDSRQLGELLMELCSRELIRPAEIDAPPSVRSRYAGYQLGWETWRDMERAVRFVTDVGGRVEPLEAQIKNLGDAARYAIDASLLDEDLEGP
jgi:hypothetical protein